MTRPAAARTCSSAWRTVFATGATSMSPRMARSTTTRSTPLRPSNRVSASSRRSSTATRSRACRSAGRSSTRWWRIPRTERFSSAHREAIVAALRDFRPNEICKIFAREHFYYNKQKVFLTELDGNGKQVERTMSFTLVYAQLGEVILDAEELCDLDPDAAKRLLLRLKAFDWKGEIGVVGGENEVRYIYGQGADLTDCCPIGPRHFNPSHMVFYDVDEIRRKHPIQDVPAIYPPIWTHNKELCRTYAIIVWKISLGQIRAQLSKKKIAMNSFRVRMAQSVGSRSSVRRWREHRSKAQGENTAIQHCGYPAVLL